MNVEIEYEPLPFQEQFHYSEKNKVYLSAGYGAGKTYALVMKMFQLMSINKSLPGGLLCPTLKMFKRDVLPTIREVCWENGIDFKYNASDYYFVFPTTKSIIYVFHGEDNGQSIRGPNLAFMLINEVSLCSKATFDAAIARVRLKKANLLQVAMSGTPESFNWCYEYFVESPRQDTDLIFGDMRLNKHVSEQYVENLLESYDEIMVKAYVEGQFVNMNGNPAAWAFNRQKHVHSDIEYDPDAETWVSLDFNLDPMVATLWNRIPYLTRTHDSLGNPIPHNPRWVDAFDEIKIGPRANTQMMCDAIKQRLGRNVMPVIFPDPAGRAGSTKAPVGQSDMTILEDNGFDDIRYKTKFRVKDQLNAMNGGFAHNRIGISPKCKNLIADLEQCTIKGGTFEIDKSDPKRTHSIDGLKNMYEYEFPITRQRPMRVEKIR